MVSVKKPDADQLEALMVLLHKRARLLAEANAAAAATDVLLAAERENCGVSPDAPLNYRTGEWDVPDNELTE